MFQNIDILAVLRLGVVGLGFLLAFMAYRLLTQAMSQQEVVLPRRYVAIGSFMAFSVLLTGMGLFAQLHTTLPEDSIKNELGSSSYMVRESTHVLDLRSRFRGATASNVSEVARSQRDVIVKIKDDNEYKSNHGTNSELGMKLDNVSHPTTGNFAKRKGSADNPFEGTLRHNYVNTVLLPSLALNQEATVVTRTTYMNAFQGEDEEWMGAEIVYPTTRIDFVILFPADKPCKEISAKRVIGDTSIDEAVSTKPFVSPDCQWVHWSFFNLLAGDKLRVKFAW